MKIRYYSHIDKDYIFVEVDAKTAHFLEKVKNDRIIRQKIEKDYKTISLSKVIEDEQPVEEVTLEDIIIYREKDRKYLNSNDYRKFRYSLKKEILKKFDIMPDYLKKVMFLRFFKDYSIGQIAKVLKVSKSSAQSYIKRGCKFIKDFLDADIKKQNEIEKAKAEKLFKKFLEKYGSTL